MLMRAVCWLKVKNQLRINFMALYDIVKRMSNTLPFDLKVNESVTTQNRLITMDDGSQCYIDEFSTGIEPEIEISENDLNLKRVIAELRVEIGKEDPTMEEIVAVVSKRFPRNPKVTENIRRERSMGLSRKLGDFFVPNPEDLPYTAMCIHKALLTQALSSTFGLRTKLTSFGMKGQIRDFSRSDNISGMHAVLTYIDPKAGEIMCADSHKGIYEKLDDYWKRFDSPKVIYKDEVIFTPDAETTY